jgi:hypothetical protein
MITNRLVTADSAAYSRKDIENAQNFNKERLILIQKQSDTPINKAENQQKNDKQTDK